MTHKRTISVNEKTENAGLHEKHAYGRLNLSFVIIIIIIIIIVRIENSVSLRYVKLHVTLYY